MSGLNLSPARVMSGTTSLSSSIHLPPSDDSRLMNPVMLPPGCGRLLTNPLPTGSDTMRKTMGIDLVSRCSSTRQVEMDQHIVNLRAKHVKSTTGGRGKFNLVIVQKDKFRPDRRYSSSWPM